MVDQAPEDERAAADDPYLAGATRVTDARSVAEVLRSRSFTTAEHEECAELTGNTVIRLDGSAHLARRRWQAALFSHAALQHYEHDLLRPMIERTLVELKADPMHSTDGVVRIDLMALSRGLLLRIAAAIIGLDGVEDQAVAQRLGSYRDVLMAGTSVERRVGDHEPVLRRAARTKALFATEFVLPSLTRRQELVRAMRAGQLTRAQLPIDLLTLLVLHGDDEVDPDRVIRECILYLAASSNTTSMVITDTVGELTQWLRAHREDADLVHDHRFLRAAVEEAMRLHPPAEVLRRRTAGRVKLADGTVLQPGQLVAAELGSANRDESVFGPTANRFDPHRLVREGATRNGLAFGAGVHMCIGRPLVLPSQGSGSASTLGAIVQILLALYSAGMRVDQRDPPEYMQTHYPHFAKLPILFQTGE
jgi:cytochrome P450